MYTYQVMAFLLLVSERELVLHRFIVEAHFAALAVSVELDHHPLFNRVYAALRAGRQHRRLFDFVSSRIDNSNKSMQHTLIYCIADFPDRSDQAVLQLRRIAGDSKSDYSNRVVAIRMLGYLNARDVKTVEVLHECVNFRPPPPMPNRPGVGGLRLIGPIRLDMASELRCAACVVLWRAEKKVNSVAPTLLEMLGSRWNGDQTSAIGAIAAIGPDLKEAVGPALMKLMYSDVRGEIYTLIPTFAPTKRIAAEELTKALLDECAYYTKFVEDYHAGRTQMTLEQFAFAHRFGYGEVNAAKNALVTLGDAAIPELITLLRRTDRSDARGTALNILRLMKMAKKGDAALKAIGEVEKLLNDPDPSVKSLAETTLKELRAK